MNNGSKKPWGWLILGLIIGLAVGAWGMRWYFNHTLLSWNPANRFVVKLDSDLHLTPDQKGKVAAILASQKEQMKDLRKNWERQVGTLGRQGEDQIAAILTPEQTDQFMRLHDEIHGRMVRFLWASDSSPTALAIAPPTK
jgi:hypothetical protein